MGQQEGGFLEAGERDGESTGSTRPTGIEVDKLEESSTKKNDDQKIEQLTKKVSKQDEKTGEQGKRARGMAASTEVSDEERVQHELTHTPFRAWCPCCMRARGRNTSHLKNQGINPGPTSFDCRSLFKVGEIAVHVNRTSRAQELSTQANVFFFGSRAQRKEQIDN